ADGRLWAGVAERGHAPQVVLEGLDADLHLDHRIATGEGLLAVAGDLVRRAAADDRVHGDPRRVPFGEQRGQWAAGGLGLEVERRDIEGAAQRHRAGAIAQRLAGTRGSDGSAVL